MNRLIQKCLLLILPFILLYPVDQETDAQLMAQDQKVGALDPVPNFLSDVPEGVCHILYCQRFWSMRRYIDTFDGTIRYGSPDLLTQSGKDCDSSQLRNCGTTWILAWQRWQATNMRLWDSSQFSEDHILTLYHRQGDSSTGGDEWRLIYIFRPAKGTEWMLENMSNAVLLPSKPTNTDIYRIVQQWSIAPEILFGFDLKKNKSGKGERTFKGIKFEMVKGEVYKKTWETVIGEKPTKFFPNGR